MSFSLLHKMHFHFALTLAAFISVMFVLTSVAQELSPAVQEGSVEATAEIEITPEIMASVLFNQNEHDLIREARLSIGRVRPPTKVEVRQDIEDQQEEEKIKPPPEERYIRLGGIVYVGSDDWTIWLNEQRVTPEALPYEVLDLKVFNNYIEIKWFDDYSNQILPIRLKSHQRFNIDTRIFLPG